MHIIMKTHEKRGKNIKFIVSYPIIDIDSFLICEKGKLSEKIGP